MAPVLHSEDMILLIDSYDSFSNNLRALIESETGKEVVCVQNDFVQPNEYLEQFSNWISKFEYIVIGPGPGHPEKHQDVGIIHWIFKYLSKRHSEAIPILGVCLGFQSLCHSFGNTIEELDHVRHGQIFTIEPRACSLFGDNPEGFESVRYHSLGIRLEDLNDEIIPLATCKDNGIDLVMAGQHKSMPFYGVQYHPESICSKKGQELICCFDKLAIKFNRNGRRQFEFDHGSTSLVSPNLDLGSNIVPSQDTCVSGLPLKFDGKCPSPVDLCDKLQMWGHEIFLLNSAAEPGDWSIIGLPITGESEVVSHSLNRPNIVRVGKHNEKEHLELDVSSVWEFLQDRMRRRFVDREKAEQSISHLPIRSSPFFGGYMGLISYEEGKHVILDNARSLCHQDVPDLKLLFIERFLIFDHTTQHWALLSIRMDDKLWMTNFSEKLVKSHIPNLRKSDVPESVKELCEDGLIKFDFPDREAYREQFEACQKHLHSGDSYELCLTTQLKIKLPSNVQAWEMYKILSLHKNPSPYSSFMAFDDCVLLSSSPERFLCWKDDEVNRKKKVVELRPIKGTVKNDASITLDMAQSLLKTPKEMGENLMIVDLIRHDLNPFVKKVDVSALMTVEKYKTVYQLVSVIRGELNNSCGWEVLAESLPPGSMTGAPKKRSIELLHEIEALQEGMKSRRRGIYSGVAGYWSITDEADWSVTIRSLFHYKHDKENSEQEQVWRIGAGGAITVLSDEEAEWDEMFLKLSSALQIFK